MPSVYQYRNRPIIASGTFSVGTMRSAAGVPKVTEVRVTFNAITVYFNHQVNSSTIGTSFLGAAPETFTLIVSDDADFTVFDPLTDTNVSAAVPHTLTYNSADYAVTLALAAGETWQGLDAGRYFQLTLDGSEITDNRGIFLDGEFTGDLPSGDNEPGGDFVFVGLLLDAADDFEDAVGSSLPLVLDGGTWTISGAFQSSSDIDIFAFDADTYDFFSVEFFSDGFAQMGVFQRDDQGTGAIDDDTFEALARWEYKAFPDSTLFEAFELPLTPLGVAGAAEYFVVVTPSPWELGGGVYQLALTLSSSDTQLLADLDGSLPDGEEIAYVSNNIGDNNNDLGANNPKQLVYLDFDGGTATKYADEYGQLVPVSAFDMASVDISLDGYEDTLINGGGDVTGIVDNVMSIFTNTPAGDPLGQLNVQRISTLAEWTDPGAVEGLYFTTVDPATWGLDPDTDFTTVFIGEANDWIFGGGLLGLASDIDVANQSKADNALVFSQNFAMYASSTTGSETDRLNQFSRAFANTAAHELGHTLGLNHQPKDGYDAIGTDDIDFNLLADDPNNDGDNSDANVGGGLMAYVPVVDDLNNLSELGTGRFSPTEFVIGHIDTQTLLLRWLS